jgi:hypothetical protein
MNRPDEFEKSIHFPEMNMGKERASDGLSFLAARSVFSFAF